MLTEKQIIEIREHLENAKNPVFFFDNDPDGLCSFLLLQRFIGRGRGVVIKEAGKLSARYFHRVEEFKADYIFVLDKPAIDKEFIEMAKAKNLTIVHIDHHPPEALEGKTEYYYNPMLVSKTNEPASDLCYKIAKRKEDIWIAAVGCISDACIPDFIDEFQKKYPELINIKYKTAFDILYKTEIGKIAMILSFGLRDTTSNVVLMMKFLMNAANPRDLLEENAKTKSFLNKFEHIFKIYMNLLERAKQSASEDILFFSYSGEVGLNRDLSNELMYLYPGKIIVIAYTKGNRANVSMRWEKGDIRTPTLKALEGLEGATGGGHEHAPGAQMPADQLKQFKENLFKEIESLKSQ